MNATDAPLAIPAEAQTARRTKATAAGGDELGGAHLLASDVAVALSDARLAFLLSDEAYERLVARLFGVPREQQSFLVKLVVAGALITVVGGLVPRLPQTRPSGTDAGIGAAVLNTAVRGIAGGPSQAIPAAGVLIGCALLARSLRSAVARSSRDVHALAHRSHARYRHHPARSVAAAQHPARPTSAKTDSNGLRRPPRGRPSPAGAIPRPRPS
jgi:hypothetical protein